MTEMLPSAVLGQLPGGPRRPILFCTAPTTPRINTVQAAVTNTCDARDVRDRATKTDCDIQQNGTTIPQLRRGLSRKAAGRGVHLSGTQKARGPAATCPDIPTAQHERGRAITDYILAVTGKGKFQTADADTLARVMDGFVSMYQNHTAREDTIVFPAWKKTLTKKQLHELSEKFEEIEHKQFGKDGFEDAVQQISDVEQALGFADLAQFTAPPPPSR